MRLADDDRGRVPFALVGALLLVAAASVATTVSRPTSEPTSPDAAVAADGAVANARTAIRSGVGVALERGAASPVLTPADTPYGRVLNESSPYRDSLRVRAYVRVQRSLTAATASVRVGGANATVSLPPVTDPDSLRAGKRRVGLEGHENGTVTATVRNVSVVVRSEDRVVSRERRTFRVTLASPALELHDRVQGYEERLHRGVVDGPGFGRQFAARLYGIAWLRGYGQYAGLPVENVVGTRHVALAANGAALASQRGAFGTADAAGARAHRRALVRVGVRDLSQPYSKGSANAESYMDAVLGDHPGGTFEHGTTTVPAVPSPSTGPGDELTVSVDETADDAFADFLAGEDGPSLADSIAESYDARLRTDVHVQQLSTGTEPIAVPPGPGWTKASESTTRNVRVEDATAVLPAPDSAAERAGAGEERRVARAGRIVTTERTIRAEWQNGNRTTVTNATTSEHVRVGIAVYASHAPNSSVAAPVPSAFRERSDLGANLVDVAATGDRALAIQGGADAIARRAAFDEFDPQVLPANGKVSNATRDAAYRDVAALRETVRNVSVDVERGSALTGDPPTAALFAEVRERRNALAPVPAEYDSVAGLASVAAQRAYLAHVERRLAARVEADRRVTSRARGAVSDALGDVTDGSVGGLADVMDAIDRTDDGRAPVVENHLVGGVDVTVAGAPSYLVVDGVDAERVPAVARDGSVHPLATRNVNVFTVPTADATSEVVDAVTPNDDATSLRAATRQLRRAKAVDGDDRPAELTQSQRRLRRAVRRSVAASRGSVADALAAETSLDGSEATVAVSDAFETYPSTTARATAIVDGSVANRIVEAAATRASDPDERWRDATQVTVEAALRRARQSSAVRPSDDRVASLRSILDSQASNVAENATREFVGGATNRTNVSFLGLPLAPVPGYWYATANVWVVEVRGTYPAFAVRARNATTGRLGTTTYVRDGSAVSVDVDGNGVADRLGYADRVTASATVPVAVVVPPGKDGIGDRDLQMFEESAAWPCPVSDRRPGAVDAAVANASSADDAAGGGGGESGGGVDEALGGECDKDMYPDQLPRGMFHEQRVDLTGRSIDDLRAEYAQDLAAAVDEHGVDAVVDETGLDRETVQAIGEGDLPEDLMLADAAAVLAVQDGVADAEDVVEIACDHLLLGMTTGVMDVDAVEGDLSVDLDAKEIQQKIERRAPMTFDEYVHIQHVIASRQA